MKNIMIISIIDLFINFSYLLICQPGMKLNINIKTNNVFAFFAKAIYSIIFAIIFTAFTLTCAWIYGLLYHIFNED